MTYSVLPGPSESIRYTRSGPYDERLGYSRIPDFVEQSKSQDFEIKAQARPSKTYVALSDLGAFPMYREKNAAGLEVLDHNGTSLFRFRNPRNSYHAYHEIPPIVVKTLLFIENRSLLDATFSHRNPAVEWQRFSRAFFDYSVHGISSDHPVIGASTLATQLEKMRHSPEGRTRSASEKARQMFSASLRAYLNGPHTQAARQQLVCDYLNSIPLAAATDHGEIIGLGDGMEIWYNADFQTTNSMLSKSENDLNEPDKRRHARTYREVLSLLLATRAPTRLLVENPETLALQTDRYLRVLSKEGVISSQLRDVALRERPVPLARHNNVQLDFIDRKSRASVRTRLAPLIGLPDIYALDRLDLSVLSTVDGPAQQSVTQFLRKLSDVGEPLKANYRQARLLAQSDPRSVIYGFILYEHRNGLNLLRIQTDNYSQPLNINEGTKLELGSTAKLRTLVNYLEIVETLHKRYAGVPAQELRTFGSLAEDRLTSWAIQYLSTAAETNLKTMLDAALDRPYSASPAEGFFTAGGLHYFRNFESSDDERYITVREAFERSVNLVFIRLMRDIERYYICKTQDMLTDASAQTNYSKRYEYLVRFADEEGRVFLRRFHRKYGNVKAENALEELALSRNQSPVALAVLFRSVRPKANLTEFAAFLCAHLRISVDSNKDLASLYERYGPDKFNLADRGYLARIHPLELWLVSHLSEHPQATLAAVTNASADERQQSYAWLFRTRHKQAQDLRIRILKEEDAFKEIWQAWRRMGYPFERLVPSYATAIGVSGDTPAALAELMGIISNRGIRYPHIAIEELRFAQTTPMETVLRRRAGMGQRVLSGDVAAIVREELLRVVRSGTARRACCAFMQANGSVLPIGGKTGTGDNRIKSYDENGRLLDSELLNRTAVFSFIIGDRFFGTVFVFVPGKPAAGYEFTSSLPVQIFKDLEPTLKPLLDH
jgi:membrane peptidoglycan carboxypeptidase